MQVPQVLITAILGLVVLFVVSTDYLVRRRQSRRVGYEMQAQDEPEAPVVPPQDTPTLASEV
jgi:hypothetical protein